MNPHPVADAAATKTDEQHLAQLRIARYIALGGWALASVAPGAALVLAQYASLFDGDPDPLNALAKGIVIGGGGLALLAWLWWGVVHFRLRREIASARTPAQAPGCSFFLWLFLAVGGVFVMSLGGNADSIAPTALLALGLGCACAIGGFLGLFHACGRWFSADLQRDRLIRAEVRATAAAQGWEIAPRSRFATAIAAVGFLVAATPMIGSYAIGSWLAAKLHVAPLAAVLGIVAAGALVCFPSLAALIDGYTRTHEEVTPEEARAYSRRSAAAATAGIAAIGVLSAVGLGFLAVVVFIGLAYLANRLRRRYLHHT